MTKTTFRLVEVGSQRVFYREAGPKNAPVVLLLHGFPSSSHMFRNLMPALADRYRVVAPDLPGFGFSDAPDVGCPHTFEYLADVIEGFTENLALDRYALYLFDYGAPVGLRVALRHPDRITAIVSQNGNAYVDGLSDGWSPIRKYWEDPTEENRTALRGFLTPETTEWQYTEGVADRRESVAPDGYTLDSALLARPGNDELQLDLFLDYASNVALYPEFQEYFREHRPPLLAVWGKNDPFFLPPGAEAFKRDIPGADVRFFDTGHFALETHLEEIAAVVREFLARTLNRANAA